MTGVSGGGMSEADADNKYLQFLGDTMLGNLLMTTTDANANVVADAAPAADHRASGDTIIDTVGENVGRGDVVYLKADGKWWKADASGTATLPGVGLVITPGSADDTTEIMRSGVFRDDSFAYTVGAKLYVDTTPGVPTETAPSGSGDQVQAVGIAKSATVVIFDPSPDNFEVA